MRPAENIKKLIANAPIKTNPAVNEAVLKDLLNELNKSEKKPSATLQPNIWKIIMKSRITQLTTAAVIIIAVIIGINQLGGPVDITTIAFADITEAMNNVPWMHQASRGFSRGVTGVGEQWFGFETKIHAQKGSDGQAMFWNLKEHKKYEYDLKNHSITIDYIYEDDFPLNMSSPVLLLESMHKMLKEQGAEIITKRGVYNGQDVQIQEISLSVTLQGKEHGKEHHILQLYIEPETRLLLSAQVKGTDANGKTIMDGEITFDYPQTGPADIYDLGVPRDALIIDKLPKEDYQAIWDKYRACRENVPDKYIAIITEAQTHLWTYDSIRIFYKDNKRYRRESHFLRWNLNAPQAVKLTVDSLGKSFEALLKWAKQNNDVSHSVGKFRNDQPVTGSLKQECWPSIGAKGKVIQDDYARENNLICIERLQQGSVYNGIVSLPGRFLYYLDPEKDYICRRKVTEWRPNAPWQEDKDWLADVEPEKIRDGSISDMEITEFIEAPNGHWYPKVIVIKQTGIRKDYKDSPLKVSTIKTVYLRIDPEFPEGIFDVDRLPGCSEPN